MDNTYHSTYQMMIALPSTIPFNIVDDAGYKTRLNGAAGPFHRGHFSGISVGMVSKMSYTQKVSTNRSDGMPILARGPTNLAEAHGCHLPVNVMMWLVADEDDGGHRGDPLESSGA